jgi:hypothetical protein
MDLKALSLGSFGPGTRPARRVNSRRSIKRAAMSDDLHAWQQ